MKQTLFLFRSLTIIIFIIQVFKCDFTFELNSAEDFDTQNNKLTFHLCSNDVEFHQIQIPCDLSIYKNYEGHRLKALVEQNGRKQDYAEIPNVGYQFYVFPDALLIIGEFDKFYFGSSEDFKYLKKHKKNIRNLKINTKSQ